MSATPPDKEPLANPGPNSLDRIYQQLVIITYVLKQMANINDEDFTWFTQPTGTVSPNINPNFPQGL